MKRATYVFLLILIFLIPKSTFAQPSGITNIAISPNGKLLAKAVCGKKLTLWNLKQDRLTLNKTLPLSCDCSGIPLAFSPDSRTLAVSIVRYGKIQLWDVKSGKAKRTLKGYGAWPDSFVFSPNGLLVAGAMGSGEIFLWNTQTGKLQYAINMWSDHDQDYSGIQTLAFLNNKNIIAGFSGGNVRIWDIATGKRLKNFSIKTNGRSWMSIDAKAKTLVSRGDHIYSLVRVWDIQTDKLRHSIPLYGLNAKGIISPNGAKLITWEWKMLKEWDVRTGKLLHRWNLKPTRSIEVFQFLPNGKQFVTSEGIDHLKFWNVY